MIAKTKTEFPFKVSTKCFGQNYCFKKSGWLLFPGIPRNYWAHRLPVKVFRENFTLKSYYAKDTMVL